jgi:rod shape-determining protein MreC
MQQIINFLIRNKSFLLFLLLFCLSLFLTIQSHSYHKSKFINSANYFTGSIYKFAYNINQYFNLKEENQKLLEENNRLKSILFNQKNESKKPFSLDSSLRGPFKLIAAQVYKNSYSSTNNYLTINKGKRDSIKEDFGVITSKGIVGIIDNTSNKYARVLSILSSTSRVNAQLKNSGHFGSLTWNGVSPQAVQLIDIPKQAPIKKGDSVITGGFSTIFPKGIPIGSVESFELDPTKNYYNVEVTLFNDMTSIGHVYVIINEDTLEISKLNNSNE